MSRRRRAVFFPPEPGAPAPLAASANRRVRFEEVDALGIVWHGRYPSYLEDGRSALGERYGLRYLDMFREGFVAPIVQMHLDYCSPLRLDEDFTIAASLHWTDAVRLNTQYLLTGAGERVIATAWTVQMLLDLDRAVLLAWPPYLEQFRGKWRRGETD